MVLTLGQKIKKLEVSNVDGEYAFTIRKYGSDEIYGSIRTDTQTKADKIIKKALGKQFKGSLKFEPLSMSGDLGMYGESFGSSGLRISGGYDKPGSKKRKGIFD